MILNVDDWKNPRDYWPKISFFNSLRFLILNDSILTDLFMGCKKFIFKLFTKERRNSSEFSDIFALLSICFSCLIIVGKVVNLLLTFVTCMIFFPCSFHVILTLDDVMVEVMVSMGGFFNYIYVPFKYLMKNCVD